MVLIGLDIGTTSCKAIIFNKNGKVLSEKSSEYEVILKKDGWAEQNANLVWDSAINTLRSALKDIPSTTKKCAMSLSVQGEAIIPVNKKFNPIDKCILGMDTRCTKENDWLRKNIGEDKLFKITGMPIHTINSLPKILWLKKNKPKIFSRAYKILLYEDYFMARLTGKAVISHCLASRTQYYDYKKSDWSDDILKSCNLSRDKFAEIENLDDKLVGTITEDIKNLLNINFDIYLTSGGHDQACAALGCGVVSPGQAMVSTGTAEVIETVLDQPKLSRKLADSGISIYKHVVPGKYLVMTLNHSGGILLKWFRDELTKYEKDGKIICSNYNDIFKNLPKSPTNLLVLPHFSGAGTPFLDKKSKGAILGLSLTTSRAEIAKSFLEGLAFELKINIDLLLKNKIKINEINAVGGGSKSDVWLQIKSDITNVMINIPAHKDAACIGAAIKAGVGTKVFKDYSDGVSSMISITKTLKPSIPVNRVYQKRYNTYKRLYPLLKSINEKLG